MSTCWKGFWVYFQMDPEAPSNSIEAVQKLQKRRSDLELVSWALYSVEPIKGAFQLRSPQPPAVLHHILRQQQPPRTLEFCLDTSLVSATSSYSRVSAKPPGCLIQNPDFMCISFIIWQVLWIVSLSTCSYLFFDCLQVKYSSWHNKNNNKLEPMYQLLRRNAALLVVTEPPASSSPSNLSYYSLVKRLGTPLLH